MRESRKLSILTVLALTVVVSTLSGCAYIPHEKLDFPSAEVPPAGELSATITVLRVKQFTSSVLSNYVKLDGLTVAKLETGQYTKFSVSEGIHSFEVFWESPAATMIVGPHIMYRDRVRKSVELSVDCRANKNYYLVIQHEFSFFEPKKLTLFKVDALDGDLALDNKTFVPPGPSDNDS